MAYKKKHEKTFEKVPEDDLTDKEMKDLDEKLLQIYSQISYLKSKSEPMQWKDIEDGIFNSELKEKLSHNQYMYIEKLDRNKVMETMIKLYEKKSGQNVSLQICDVPLFLWILLLLYQYDTKNVAGWIATNECKGIDNVLEMIVRKANDLAEKLGPDSKIGSIQSLKETLLTKNQLEYLNCLPKELYAERMEKAEMRANPTGKNFLNWSWFMPPTNFHYMNEIQELFEETEKKGKSTEESPGTHFFLSPKIFLYLIF